MNKITKNGVFILSLLYALTVQAEGQNNYARDQSAIKPGNTAIIPTPKLENDFYDWYERHEQVKELIRKQPVDLVFIGDSITHMFGDGVHPNENGYRVWAESTASILKKLLAVK